MQTVIEESANQSRGAGEAWIPSVSAIVGLFWPMIPCRQRVRWAFRSAVTHFQRETALTEDTETAAREATHSSWKHTLNTHAHKQVSAHYEGFEVNVLHDVYKWEWDFSEVITCAYTSHTSPANQCIHTRSLSFSRTTSPCSPKWSLVSGQKHAH